MRLRIEIDTGQPSTSTSGGESDHSERWLIIEKAWASAQQATGEQRSRDLHWVGGAIAMYAAFTGQSAEALRSRLESRAAGRQEPEPSPTILPKVDLRPGRSTPPPPRHPGAQRVVDNLSTP